MSRIGRLAIKLPKGTSADVKAGAVSVKGPKGAASIDVPAELSVEQREDELVVGRTGDDRQTRSLHGLTRKLLANAVGAQARLGPERRLDLGDVRGVLPLGRLRLGSTAAGKARGERQQQAQPDAHAHLRARHLTQGASRPNRRRITARSPLTSAGARAA